MCFWKSTVKKRSALKCSWVASSAQCGAWCTCSAMRQQIYEVHAAHARGLSKQMKHSEFFTRVIWKHVERRIYLFTNFYTDLNALKKTRACRFSHADMHVKSDFHSFCLKTFRFELNKLYCKPSLQDLPILDVKNVSYFLLYSCSLSSPFAIITFVFEKITKKRKGSMRICQFVWQVVG